MEAVIWRADGCCLENRCLMWKSRCIDADATLATRKLPNKMSCSWHSAEQLHLFFSFPFPFLLLYLLITPSALPCNQSRVPSQIPLAVNQMELLAGILPLSINFVIHWMLWLPTSWFVSAWSVLQGQSHFLHWRLVTFHANHIATEHLLWWDEQFFIFWCYLYYVLITGRASRT